jgi:3-dehydroquinate dehydratase-2
MKKILVINGPNLNLLGTREPELYGRETLADIEAMLKSEGERLNLRLDCRQSNHEGWLIDWIHEGRTTSHGIIINAGAYSHTSIAIQDALAAYPHPVIEVHLSNIYAREPFRHHSVISSKATGVICGLGSTGYRLALAALAEKL